MSKENILITIIIPAYNSASYLERCIDSMANQDMPLGSYEALVINDGSTDNSVELLDELCAKYSFLRYITKENGGLSSARNRGIDEAYGKYILFVDSDDAVANNIFGTIYNEMLHDDLDMLLLGYRHISLEGADIPSPFHIERNPKTVVDGKTFLSVDEYLPMVCMYAFKRSFLIEHQLKMMPIWHEDEEFTPRALYYAQRVKYLPILFYYYYQNSSSYMETYTPNNQLYLMKAMISLDRFSEEVIVEHDMKRYFKNHIANHIMTMVKNSIKRGYNNQEELFLLMRESELLPLRPNKRSHYTLLMNLSPQLFEKFYRLIKNKPKR